MDRRHHFALGVAVGIALVLLVAFAFWAAQTQSVERFLPPSNQTISNISGLHVGPEKALASASQEPDSSICLYGCPGNSSPKDQIVAHHILILANNPDTKYADWVAYRITRETLGSHCQRRWETDPDIDSDNTLEPRDYVGLRQALQSDRGHQAPLASLCGSPAWQEADYLSNITPQKTDLNEGAWERLENAERRLLASSDISAVYSVTGTLYERPMPALPRSHLPNIVPSGYWKVIAVALGSGLRAAAFIMDQNTPREADYCSEQVPIGEVERRSHLKLFPKLNGTTTGLAPEQNGLMQALGCQ